MNTSISPFCLYTPNKKLNSIPNSPRRMIHKMYRTLVINTDSDIKNNINCFHLIKNLIILWAKNTSLISETTI